MFIIAETRLHPRDKMDCPLPEPAPPLITGLSQPNSLAVDASGDVYIVDAGDNTVKQMDGRHRAPSPCSPPPD